MDLLQQMLLNLCINARDAMPDGGKLILKTQRVELSQKYCELHPAAKPGAYVMFSVADTGCGIPPELKPRIFEPFFTTKGVGKGTGLGLAMVYGCVQQHGGTINVYSEPNLGTTFKIYLPIVADADAVIDDVAATPAAGGQETILIAEDEPMVRDLAVRILTARRLFGPGCGRRRGGGRIVRSQRRRHFARLARRRHAETDRSPGLRSHQAQESPPAGRVLQRL